MADPCVHQHQTVVYTTPDDIRYQCIDCNVRIAYVPMTIAEIREWIGAKQGAGAVRVRVIPDKEDE